MTTDGGARRIEDWDVLAADEITRSRELRVWTFVLMVAVCGAAALGLAVHAVRSIAFDWWMVVLSALFLTTGRFSIKVPGRPATVSVSEVFLFTSLILYGPGPATLMVAVDGLWASFNHRDRRLYRTLFNVAEPSLSTLAAGTIFFVVAGLPPFEPVRVHPDSYLVPSLAMAASYFLFNSLLQAAAVAIESGETIADIWSQHALYLGINYYAAASLATLAVQNAARINLEVLGLVVPLLVLSYAAYKSAASRIEDADLHLKDVEQLYQATVETLAVAVDAKDQVTHGHIRRVQRHTLVLARALGVREPLELKAVAAAALLHDVGKLAVPDYVLNKPGRLSRTEFDRMKLHSAKGAEILTAVGFPYPVVPIVRHHHEQWDGNGYPDRLIGEAIPLGARILSVVDCFDALTSDRPYRRRMTDEDAVAIVHARRGTMYDPRVVDAFMALLPELRTADLKAEGPAVPAGETAGDATGSRERGEIAFEATRPLLVSHLASETAGRLADAMPGSEVCLFSPDAGNDMLGVVYATPAIAKVVSRLNIRTGDGLAGWVAANRHTIANSDASLDLGDAATTLGLSVCTATPVFAFGALVAVLCVYAPGKFTEDRVRTIGALAQEIGLELARHEQRSSAGTAPAPSILAVTHAEKRTA